MINATNMSPREHQALIRANIAAAMAAGDLDKANVIRHAFADLLAIKFDEPKPDRIPNSPINYCCLDSEIGVKEA